MLVDGSLQSGLELVVRNARIAEIRPSKQPVNLPDRMLLPGFVNAHSHAFQRGIRGLVQHGVGEDNFWSWRARMYELAVRLSPEDLRAVSALAYLEMVQAGFTAVGEFHYLHHQPNGQPYADRNELALQVAEAAQDVGLRLCLLRVAYARAGAGQVALREQLRFCDQEMGDVLRDVDALATEGRNRFSVGLAAHSMRALSLEQLRALSSFDGPIHAHVDEQPGEVAQSLEEHGCRPLEVFARAGLLSERFCAVHFTHPSDQEIAILRSSGAQVVACPTTEMDLGDGFLPLEKLGGIPLSIGTDSHARIDPLAEIRALEWHARARLGQRCVFVQSHEPDALAAALVKVGTRGGAQALGLDTGEIAVGRKADFIAVETTSTALSSGPLLTNFVFSGQPGFVKDAWVAGKQILFDGRHPREESIRSAALKVLSSV
jgi:formimidoylglutamate deiminase